MALKKIMFATLLLLTIITIGAVSASEDIAGDNVTAIEPTGEQTVQAVDEIKQTDELIAQTDNDEILSEKDDGTFTALQNKIDNAAEAKEVVSVEGNDGFDDLMSDVNDNVLGNSIYVNGSTFTDIGNAIDSAVDGDIIYLNSPYYEGSGSHIAIKKDITIIGNHSTLDAKYLSQIAFSNNKVTLINITFINGYNDGEGGAVYIKGSGSFVNCNFVNNSAHNRGGAVLIGSSSSGSFVSCNFVNNFAKREEGGAVFSFGPTSFDDCSFMNNHASYQGGAVYISDSFSEAYGSFVGCSFVNNSLDLSSYSYGGAVYIKGSSSSSFVECSFVNNSANTYSGAVYIKGSGKVSFVDCSFVNNYGDYVGAVKISSSGSFVDCSFVNNNAGVGSGAVSTDGSCNFENCSFVNNNGGPGAVLSQGESNSFVNCSFANNSAEYDDGGAVYIFSSSSESSCSGNFVNCNFMNNSVKKGNGGAVYIDYSCSSSFVNCSFVNNSVELGEGGAAYIGSSGTGSFVKCLFMDNVADSIRNDIVGYELIVSDVDKFYGENKKFVVVLVDGEGIPVENAYVNITLNNKKSPVKTDSKGQASVDLNLGVGTYDVLSEYGGVSATSKVTVKSTLAVSNATGTYLNSKVTATFLNTNGKALASKQVTFKVNGKDYTSTTNGNGVAAADIDLGVGTYTVTAVNPVNNEQKEFKLVISKAASKIALASSQSGEVVTLTVALTPSAATGSVIFTVNGENKTTTIKSGKATLTLTDLKAGNYTVTAFYNGDNNLDASASNTISFSVSDVYPVLTAKGVTKTYGTTTKLVVYLKDNKGNAIANANVNVDIKGKVTPITTNSNGQATMAIGQAPGTYYAKITYPKAKQVTAKIVVKKATPKLTAAKKTFKRTVKVKNYVVILKTNKNKALKSVWVSLKVNKKTYKVKTNVKGQAIFKINNLAKKGIYKAVVKFAGNKYYNAKTVNTKIAVR